MTKSNECQHLGITGEGDNWICNWCDFINGKPTKEIRELHKDFVINRLIKGGHRQLAYSLGEV